MNPRMKDPNIILAKGRNLNALNNNGKMELI
jgi:hypothetical protein